MMRAKALLLGLAAMYVCLHGCLWLSLDLSLDSTVDSWMQPPGIARVSYELPILALRMAVPASERSWGSGLPSQTRDECLGVFALAL